MDESATHQAVCPVVENATLTRQLAVAQRRIASFENDKQKGEKDKIALQVSFGDFWGATWAWFMVK
jgi:hypothetical protein